MAEGRPADGPPTPLSEVKVVNTLVARSAQ